MNNKDSIEYEVISKVPHKPREVRSPKKDLLPKIKAILKKIGRFINEIPDDVVDNHKNQKYMPVQTQETGELVNHKEQL